MPFLGVEPVQEFASVAKQTITGDGSTAYTLTHSVGSANDLAVFVNNVRQEPTTAYSASGSTITFTEAIASTDSCYVMYIARTFSSASPEANSVGITELNVSDGSNGQALTTNGSGTLSFATTSPSANSIGITQLNVSDGSSGQALTTNGSGTLSFATVTTATPTLAAVTGAGATTTNAVTVGNLTSTGIDDNADATAITIDTSENVGIGTTSTTALRLSVATPTANHVATQIENSNTDDSFGLIVKAGNDANDYTADFRKRDNTGIMRIRGDGKVGIGTTSPAETLHVNGNGTFGSGATRLTTYSDTTYSGIYNGSSLSSDECIYMGAGVTYFKNDGSEYMRATGGKVSIGTTGGYGRLNLQDNSNYTGLIELYGSGNKSTYVAGRIGVYTNNDFTLKIGGVYGGWGGLAFSYYYLHPLIQETLNNGSLRLGESIYRFHTVYAVNGVSTSDQRTKEEIENLDVGLDFIKSLQPKKFKYKDKDEKGEYKDGKLNQPNGVKKWGLVAQDVKKVLDDNSITEDLGLWSVDKGECNGTVIEDQQQLQYQELIAPLINAVKEQQVMIEELKTEVAALKG